jgi:hypothetical protein
MPWMMTFSIGSFVVAFLGIVAVPVIDSHAAIYRMGIAADEERGDRESG